MAEITRTLASKPKESATPKSYGAGIPKPTSISHNPMISNEWLENNGYVNAAKLWKKYSTEELAHSDWSREYLLSMGVQPSTPMLNAPTQNFSGLPEIIKLSFDHEITVTMQIKDLATDAQKKGDHMLYELALKFLKEQVEEHNKMQNWKDQLAAFGEDKIAMRLLDHEIKDYL